LLLAQRCGESPYLLLERLTIGLLSLGADVSSGSEYMAMLDELAKSLDYQMISG
jgi:hypothetical protein